MPLRVATPTSEALSALRPVTDVTTRDLPGREREARCGEEREPGDRRGHPPRTAVASHRSLRHRAPHVFPSAACSRGSACRRSAVEPPLSPTWPPAPVGRQRRRQWSVKQRASRRPGETRPQAPRAASRARSVQGRMSPPAMRRTDLAHPPLVHDVAGPDARMVAGRPDLGHRDAGVGPAAMAMGVAAGDEDVVVSGGRPPR